MFVKIFQVLANERMDKKSKLVEFSTQKRFQIRACVIRARKAKYLDSASHKGVRLRVVDSL